MTIGKICTRETYLAKPYESLLAAAERMQARNVGTLIVLDDERRPVGVLTDRDLVVRGMAAGRDLRGTNVSQVMTRNPRTVTESTPIESVLQSMRSLGVRRMPVVDDERRLVGLISVDDVLELLAEELASLGRILGWSRPRSSPPVRTPLARELRRHERQAAS